VPCTFAVDANGEARRVEMLRQPFSVSNRKMDVSAPLPPTVIALLLLQLRSRGDVDGRFPVANASVLYGGKTEIRKVSDDGTTGRFWDPEYTRREEEPGRKTAA